MTTQWLASQAMAHKLSGYIAHKLCIRASACSRESNSLLLCKDWTNIPYFLAQRDRLASGETY